MSTPHEQQAKPGSGPGQRPAERDVPVTPDGPGVVRRTTDTAKRIALVLIGALFALFAVQNRSNVEIQWIFGDPIQTPLILALLVVFAAGAAIGWLFAKLSRRRARPKTAAKT